MLVLGTLRPGRDEVREAVAARRQPPVLRLARRRPSGPPRRARAARDPRGCRRGTGRPPGPLRRATQSFVGASKTSSTDDPLRASFLTSRSSSWSTSWIIRAIVRSPGRPDQPPRGSRRGSSDGPFGQQARPSACPAGPCRGPRAVGASAYPVVLRSEGAPHAELPVPRRLHRGGGGWFPSDRGRRNGRRRVRRARRARTRQHADARHELEPVHPDVRRLHRGLVPRPCRLRLLPERRRRGLRRPHRCGRGDADGDRPADERRRQGHRDLSRVRARGGTRRQRHHRRRRAVVRDRGEHLQDHGQPGRQADRDVRQPHHEQGQAERRHGRQGAVEGHRPRGGRQRGGRRARPRRPARSASAAAARASRSGSRRTTTSATAPIGPASPGSRRSTRSRCSASPTSWPSTRRASSTSRASRPSSWR